MPLIWTLQGPTTLPGQLFAAALGTAAAFSAGPAVAYTGLALANPATPPGQIAKKLVPLRINISPTVIPAATTPIPWGLMKLTGQGTASNGGMSAFSGAVFCPAINGTSTPVAIVGGTFSVVNGTAAGTGSNTLYWIEVAGCLGGTGGTYQSPNPAADLQGHVAVYPGETICLAVASAVTGLASIAWVEIPLNSGA
jgi:hypothetical protein